MAPENPNALNMWQEYYIQIGSQKQQFDVNALLEPTYIQYALDRLGTVQSSF
ncbi:MAG: hypothetical protein JOZ87_29290 [Chloroflexi bacterium]|nr:hypothetical protein [Chloroflexota bacterium]